MNICLLITRVLLASAFFQYSIRVQAETNNAQVELNPSQDGRTILRDGEGSLVIVSGREEADLLPIRRARQKGDLPKALKLCQEILATNSTHRWAINERMLIMGETGEFDKSRQDFEYLTQHYPDFLEAYDCWASILLERPMSESGKSEFLDWLDSSDLRKQTAAKHVIMVVLRLIQSNENEWLNSPDPNKKRVALQILQFGVKLRANPKQDRQ